MNTNDESTVYENVTTETTEKTEVTERELQYVPMNGGQPIAKTGRGKKVAAAMTAGILGGAAAGVAGTMLMGEMAQAAEPAETTENEEVELEAPVDDSSLAAAVTDGEVAIATTVDDSMSFSDAFAAARAEVGPGGVFEWHGQVYGTYYETEWNNMSPAEQSEYYSHMQWGGGGQAEDYHTTVNHHEDIAEVHHTGGGEPDYLHHNSGSEEIVTDDSSVEILGMEHVITEDGQEWNVGGLAIDGQEVVVLDVDNDMMGDFAMADLNQDGQMQEDELIDLTDSPIPMDVFEDGAAMEANYDVDAGMPDSFDL